MNEMEKVREIILKTLRTGPVCRIELNRQCCIELGYDAIPEYNDKGQRIRICRKMPDNHFDRPLNELKKEGRVQWKRKGQYVLYELAKGVKS
jgi:hypothetical protein